MDSSKILPGSEECSSSESGWTTYIASPDLEHDIAENEEDEMVDEGGSVGRRGYKKRAEVEDEGDSDDSMASDASSGPSDQRYSYGYLGRNHAGSNNERKSVAKKHNQQEEKKKKKQTKEEKDKAGNKANSGGRLKKF